MQKSYAKLKANYEETSGTNDRHYKVSNENIPLKDLLFA